MNSKSRVTWRRGRGSVLLVSLAFWAVFALAAWNLRGDEGPEHVYGDPVRTGTITDSRIRELSGMIPVSAHVGHYWIHNDSKGVPSIFAVREDGRVIAEVRVTGAALDDWEDIACGPGSNPEIDTNYLFIADTGNNALDRTTLTIYRVPEPTLTRLDPGQVFSSAPAEKIPFRYPDGVYNNEALIVHPETGVLYVITKRSGTAGVYRFPSSAPSTTTQTLVRIASMRPGDLVTAADLSQDACRLLVRTFAEVLEYRLPAGSSFETIFRQTKRVLPDAEAETKSESICFAHDDRDIITSTEGTSAPIHRIPVRIPQPFCASPGTADLPFYFVRGDVDGGGQGEFPTTADAVNVADLVMLTDVLRGEQTIDCPSAADVDDDGLLTAGDFGELAEDLVQGSSLPDPFPEYDFDPTADDLGCHETGRVEIIQEGDEWFYWSADDAPPAGWHEVGASTVGWAQGPGGVGFGSDALRTELGAGASRQALFARREFDLTLGWRPEVLLLQIDYNDGFVAYLNGIEVGRRGLGSAGLETPVSQPASLHRGGTMENVFLCLDPLVAGRNVFALQVHNTSSRDASLFFRARLLGIDLASPAPPAAVTTGSRLYMSSAGSANVGDTVQVRLLYDSEQPVRAISTVFSYGRSFLQPRLVYASETARDATLFRTRTNLFRAEVAVVLVMDDASEPTAPLPAGTGVHWATIEFDVGATAPGETTVAFTRRIARLPLSSLLALADASVDIPATTDETLTITVSEEPTISAVINGQGKAGDQFFVVGSRFDRDGLSVTVCDIAAAFELFDDSLRVVAPPCGQAGYAAVKVCTTAGCAVVEEGFLYKSVGPPWIRGDANGDGVVNIADALAILGELFSGLAATPACREALDANADGRTDISDPILVLTFLFQGIGEIPEPFQKPGTCVE